MKVCNDCKDIKKASEKYLTESETTIEELLEMIKDLTERIVKLEKDE